ncbi:Non-hemolytic phospholipase C [Triticum urartu]|uniref:Non-hemolytic phospholipase C n=1 Tax=Triticum urartu TaxID=4572 RepID=M7ZJT6_TRIUA|nr:Non-hemolytic phospholipase C [Triticum urartu]
MPPPMGMRALLLLLLLAFAAGTSSAAPSGASPIKNVVVLALENRSFDHMLGWMRRLLGLPIDGLTGAACHPNRLFLYSATSHGAVAHDKWNLLRGYPQRPIFDSLAADGRRFNVYFKTIPTTLFYRNLRTVRAAAQSFHFYDSAFRDHARRGRLPALSVIEPRYFDLTGTPADDDHPAHDVANGQRLVKDVYETLRASPQWNDTLLIVTYDEHGGFYDHVATPVAGVPSPDGLRGPVPFFFKFDRLGVRVPTMMVSPWIKKGTVVGRPPNGPTATSEYEHSSIPATIKKIFNLRSDFLTKRDEWAGTFEHIFTQLDQPRTDCPETLPEVPFERTTPTKDHGILSDFQRELVELASFLNGDYMLTSSAQETQKKMTVKQADTSLLFTETHWGDV